MQAARDHGLGRKFKLGRNILSGTIFSRACPKWMNPTEFRPNSVESQNRGIYSNVTNAKCVATPLLSRERRGLSIAYTWVFYRPR